MLLYPVFCSWTDFTLSATHTHEEMDVVRRIHWIQVPLCGDLALEDNLDGSWDIVHDGRKRIWTDRGT